VHKVESLLPSKPKARYSEAHTIPQVLSAPRVEPRWENTDLSVLKPLYPCHDAPELPGLPGRATKLAFVHIFKTVGTTVRGLFKRYAYRCNVGYQITIGCTNANATLLQEADTPWMHALHGRPCQQKKGITRNREHMEVSKTFNGRYLEEHIDIMGGHMPLGVADFTWMKYNDVKYIAFFREAMSKFVSARMYRKERTLDEHVAKITSEVASRLQKGKYYESYCAYLLTPQQKAQLNKENRTLSIQETVYLVQKNISTTN
jgi:hypothetical protein